MTNQALPLSGPAFSWRACARRFAPLAFVLGLVFAAGSATVGCASTPAVPMKKENLDGAKYKLLAASSGMDMRVVQFRKVGPGFKGVIVEKGKFLGQLVGIQDEMETFVLRPVEGFDNVYEGLYRTVNPDGTPFEAEVRVTFYEDHFDWNLGTATWSRVE